MVRQRALWIAAGIVLILALYVTFTLIGSGSAEVELVPAANGPTGP